MFYKTAVCAAALSALSTVASAQQFTGGTLGLEYRSFDGGDVTSYFGGVEFGFNRDFAVELDLEGADSDGGSANSATLHGIYHLNESSSVGAFYGQTDDDVSFYGIEGGTLWGRTAVGGHLGQREADDVEGLSLGFNTETPFSNGWEFYTDFDYVRVDGDWVNTEELGIQYNLANGPELYAMFGRLFVDIDGAGSASADYLGIGARINFGARPGTTFEAR